MIYRALIVRSPHANDIVSNGKIWEMRSRKTNVRGRVGIIEAGSGLIIGETEIVDCLAPQSDRSLIKNLHCHHVDDLNLLKNWRIPWVLKDSIKYDNPIEYEHPKGAVIWVKLNK